MRLGLGATYESTDGTACSYGRDGAGANIACNTATSSQEAEEEGDLVERL
jgi:hypothetical protein